MQLASPGSTGSAISGNLGGIIGKKIRATLRANRWWRSA